MGEPRATLKTPVAFYGAQKNDENNFETRKNSREAGWGEEKPYTTLNNATKTATDVGLGIRLVTY